MDPEVMHVSDSNRGDMQVTYEALRAVMSRGVKQRRGSDIRRYHRCTERGKTRTVVDQAVRQERFRATVRASMPCGDAIE